MVLRSRIRLSTVTITQEDEERLAGLTGSDVLKVQEAAGAALAEANERLLEAELRVQAAQVRPVGTGEDACSPESHVAVQTGNRLKHGAILNTLPASSWQLGTFAQQCGTPWHTPVALNLLLLAPTDNGHPAVVRNLPYTPWSQHLNNASPVTLVPWLLRQGATRGAPADVMSSTGGGLCSLSTSDVSCMLMLQAAQRLEAAEQLQQDVEALKTENLEAWRQKYKLESQLATVRATMEGMQVQACSMQKVRWVRAGAGQGEWCSDVLGAR